MSYSNTPLHQHAQHTYPTPGPVPDAGGSRRLALIGISVGAVVVLLATLFLTRALTGGAEAPGQPSGLSVNFKDGKVSAVWNQVPGADGYLLLRGENVIVYSGPDTRAVDEDAPEGELTYQVVAVNRGVPSYPSDESTVTVQSSWGDLGALVAQFPDLLPQLPSQVGWRDMSCMPMVRANTTELGPDVDGSGQVTNRARLGCNTRAFAMHVIWYISEEARSKVYAKFSTDRDLQPISWRLGSGYVDEEHSELVLRPDRHPEAIVMIGQTGASRDELLEIANALPLD